MHVLILGGTTEASALARSLGPPFRVTLSLAGRTRAPVLPAVPNRRGGFGGAAGLADWLRTERVDALVDATHPFAAVISANAAMAAREAGVPRLVILRPAWSPGPGDRWTEVPDMAAAVAALGVAPRRVFLTVGQQELAPFRAAPQHEYLIRSVEPPDPAALPPRARCIAARGPFEEAGEMALMAGVEVVVTKNSGGAATAPKLAAARRMAIPVIMVARPPAPPPPHVGTAAAAEAWLDHAALRGV